MEKQEYFLVFLLKRVSDPVTLQFIQVVWNCRRFFQRGVFHREGNLHMKTSRKICVFSMLLAGFCLATSARADALFTFDTGVATGTDTPFDLTNNGVTAEFSSTTGAFEVEPNFGFAAPFSGNLLADSSEGNNAFIPLIISFNTLVTGITLDFATDDPDGASTFELAAFNGSNEVGGNSGVGTYLTSFPQGVLSFSGVSFDSVQLFDFDTPAFAIDNVDVSGASGATFGVPEINGAGVSSLAVLLLGSLAWLEGFRSKTRRA
jgi:hypothetical protein